MALFKKKNTEKEVTEEVKAAPIKSSVIAYQKGKKILMAPRVTEKSAILADAHTYTFEVDRDANKKQIKDTVKEVYGVSPARIRTVSLPYKKVQRGSRTGVKGGVKKAYVTLKPGDKIELF